MTLGVLDLLEGACEWTGTKIAGTKPEQWTLPTPCDDWDVRLLLDHIIVSGDLFAIVARGEFVSFEAWQRPAMFTDDPLGAYEATKRDLLESFRRPGVLERALLSTVGRAPGADQATRIAVGHMAHGWDLAKATGQDTTMPPELAETALERITGMIPDAARAPSGMGYKPVVPTDADATAQDKLIAYLGRQPA